MNTMKRYSPEVRERAVRLVFEHEGEHALAMGGGELQVLTAAGEDIVRGIPDATAPGCGLGWGRPRESRPLHVRTTRPHQAERPPHSTVGRPRRFRDREPPNLFFCRCSDAPRVFLLENLVSDLGSSFFQLTNLVEGSTSDADGMTDDMRQPEPLAKFRTRLALLLERVTLDPATREMKIVYRLSPKLG